MKNKLKNSKYLILRRTVQFSILTLFMSSSYFGYKILMGNYSAAQVFELFYLADPYATLQVLFSGFLPASELLIGAGIVVVTYSIINGRLFCSWVCPLNIITDFANYLQIKLNIKPIFRSSDYLRFKKLRYYLLALGLVLSLFSGIAAFEIINPISMLHRSIIFFASFNISVVLIVFLFDLLIFPNFWCGHLCPVGAFYSIIGKYSFLRVLHNNEKCTKCMKCIKVCPEPQIMGIIGKEKGLIKSSLCTTCGRCIDVCNDDSLKFNIRKII